ncbi:sigma-54-dependent Fis family transcriptional regulator, partial [Candidatus Sumerlaeota bacterium]|nr:sigma-54-dependent Fis family transcriptional regulator [Candidatus Sumerlaeota bacterium]
ESGTGKELIARAIHQRSDRDRKPFIAVNCGALSPTLLESELFGHERGAFTHAIRQKPGRFELADSGSLFLDEVSETSLDFQVKLLRVIETGRFERVGGTETLHCDVRIIAATNKDLDCLVREGRFRTDLLYRLKVITICLPPLRERRDDIPLLVQAFLVDFCQAHSKNLSRVHTAAMDILARHPWPGNVRQLRNVIESAVIMADKSENEIAVQHLPADICREAQVAESAEAGAEVRVRVGASLAEAERELIRATLAQAAGNRARAARLLGIGRKTLYRKIVEYGL